MDANHLIVALKNLYPDEELKIYFQKAYDDWRGREPYWGVDYTVECLRPGGYRFLGSWGPGASNTPNDCKSKKAEASLFTALPSK